MPRVSGPGREQGKIYVSQEVDRALVQAEKLADRMKDEYVSVEHVMGSRCSKTRTARWGSSFHASA